MLNPVDVLLKDFREWNEALIHKLDEVIQRLDTLIERTDLYGDGK